MNARTLLSASVFALAAATFVNPAQARDFQRDDLSIGHPGQLGRPTRIDYATRNDDNGGTNLDRGNGLDLQDHAPRIGAVRDRHDHDAGARDAADERPGFVMMAVQSLQRLWTALSPF